MYEMAQKRKRGATTSRKTTMRKRRVFRRKTAIPRMSRSLNSGMIVPVKRKFWTTNFTPSTVATSNFAPQWTFALGSMPDYANYIALFDEFKLNAVKVDILPRFSVGAQVGQQVGLGVSTNYQQYVTIVKDPAMEPPAGTYSTGTLNKLLESGRSKTHNGNRAISVYSKVFMRQGGAAGEGINSQIIRPRWIKTTDFNTTHYGITAMFWDSTFDFTMLGVSYDIFYTFYLQFRNPKGF